MTTTNEPVTGEVLAPASDYPLLDQNKTMQKMLRVIDDNFSPQQFNIRDLSRIKLLRDSGQFEVAGAAGTRIESSLTGVITTYRPSRILWGKAYNANQPEPPACSSMDGFVGVGDPGGDCTVCPLREFNTARGADGSPRAGQACRELRQILFLLPGQMLPHHLDVGPTSLKYFNKYVNSLPYLGASWWNVITKLESKMESTKGGFSVPRILFSLVKPLTDPQIAMLAPYHQRLSALLKPMVVNADRYEIEGGAAPSAPPKDDDIPF